MRRGTDSPSDTPDCKLTALYSVNAYSKLEPQLYANYRCYVYGHKKDDGTFQLTAEGIKEDEKAIKKIMSSVPEFINFI